MTMGKRRPVARVGVTPCEYNICDSDMGRKVLVRAGDWGHAAGARTRMTCPCRGTKKDLLAFITYCIIELSHVEL